MEPNMPEQPSQPTPPSYRASDHAHTGQKHGHAWIIWLVIVILVVGAGFLTWRHLHKGQAPQAGGGSGGGRHGGRGAFGPIMVSTEAAKKGSIGIYVNA